MITEDFEKLIFWAILRNALPSSAIPKQIIMELTPDKFDSQKHQLIYKAMGEVIKANDLPSVANILTALGEKKLNIVGGEPYIRSLYNFGDVLETTTTQGWRKWVNLVDVAGMFRQLGPVITQYRDKIYEDFDGLVHYHSQDGKFDEFLLNFMNDIQKVGTFGKQSAYVHVSSLYEQEKERLHLLGQGIRVDLLNIGWPSFAKYGIPRLGVGHVIAGLSGSGKTQLALMIAMGVASNLFLKKEAGHVTYNALEDDKENLYIRMGCTLAGIDSTVLNSGNARPEELDAYDNALQFINMIPFFIDDNSLITSKELVLEATLLSMLQKDSPRKLGVADYSDMFMDKGDNEVKRLGDIMRRLHGFASTNHTCEILVSQYPGLPHTPSQIGGSKTKHSRDLFNACKVFIEVWNLPQLIKFPNVYPDFKLNNLGDKYDINKAHIFIHKNNNGVQGHFPMHWIPRHTQFIDTEIEGEAIYDWTS